LFGGNASSLPQPAGQWLLCDGSAVNRFTYQDLFGVIGTTFGSGNGINTFNLPDFRTRFPLGSNSNPLVSGGNPTHTLTVAELPSHNHDQGSLVTLTNGAHSHSITDPGHNHGGSTGLAAYSAGSDPMAATSGGHGDDSGVHSHSIATDFTGISVQSNGNHVHTISGSTGSSGSGQAINMMPPYQIINYIIRT
jgi:microcystin-dependent protein